MESEQEIRSSLWKQLLPGICDEITLANIVTRLPWTAFHELSAVSRTWKLRIQTREVYGERIRSDSTDTLVVIKHHDEKKLVYSDSNSISLYSMTEKTFYRLPPIPQLESGISACSQFISVDGKLYVLGAGSLNQYKFDILGNIYYDKSRGCRPLEQPEPLPIYVLDLAGQGQWKECKNVEEPKREYTINIAGGFKLGEKTFVRGGSADWFKSFWQTYDAVADEGYEEEQAWRGVDPSQMYFGHTQRFMVQGKHYLVNRSLNLANMNDIEVYDISTESWAHRHSISCREIEKGIMDEFGPINPPPRIDPFFILPVNNELLALARWTRTRLGLWPPDEGCFVLQTKGFGSGKKELVWEKSPNSSLQFNGTNLCVAICLIQL